MTTTTHNGWTNYETWAVNLWLTNGSDTDGYWRGVTRECWDAAEKQKSKALSRSEEARYNLADRLKADVEEDAPDILPSMYLDMLNAAISEVDWSEIANAFLDGIPGYEPVE